MLDVGGADEPDLVPDGMEVALPFDAMFDSESGRQGFAFLTWIVQNQITRKIIDQGESAAELGKNRLFGSDHFE